MSTFAIVLVGYFLWAALTCAIRAAGIAPPHPAPRSLYGIWTVVNLGFALWAFHVWARS